MSDASRPENWVKGQHEDHDVVILEVAIRRDKLGRVLSGHRLQEEQDHEIALSWPSGGLEQVAFALLVEAIRREAILDVAMMASQDKEFLNRWRVASEEERKESLVRMGTALRTGVNQTIARITEGALRDALTQFSPPAK